MCQMNPVFPTIPEGVPGGRGATQGAATGWGRRGWGGRGPWRRRYFARSRRLRGQHGGQRDGVTVTVSVFLSRFPRLREPESVFVRVWRVAKIARRWNSER